MIPHPQPTQPINRWQQARSLILRWLISSLAIFAAVFLVPGIQFIGPGWQIGVVALIFGLINVALRPLLALLTCPLTILTFGLFGLVINAVLLALTSGISRSVGVHFVVDGFWSAVFGGLIISLVSLVLHILAGETPVRVVIRRE